jgi:hypothetical protein
MDRSAVLVFPRPSRHPLELDRAEVEAAVELVATGHAKRVRLVELRRPEAIAASALALAQRHGLGFDVSRSGARLTLTIGPRLVTSG